MMEFSSAAGLFILKAEQHVNSDLETVWDFFSSPKNLPKITLKKMDFRITNNPSEKTYAGQIITYSVRIFPLLRSNWVTEITQYVDGDRFVDEQRFGPYAMWHHEHIFEKTDSGTKMYDIIHFKMPFGFLGRFAFHLYAKKEISKIFEHRHTFVEEYFNKG